MPRILWLALVPALFTGCQMDSRQQILASTNSQVAQRAISTRAFETPDRAKVFQAVIASLQDLGFVVDRADPVLGSISATRYGAQLVRFTVSIRLGTDHRTVVRASGQLNQHELSDAAPFQRFFEALSQALFLEASALD